MKFLIFLVIEFNRMVADYSLLIFFLNPNLSNDRLFDGPSWIFNFSSSFLTTYETVILGIQLHRVNMLFVCVLSDNNKMLA